VQGDAVRASLGNFPIALNDVELAGFDAHTRDPLANLNLVEADFSWVTQKLMEIADVSAKGRVVSLLEGGYDLQGLSRSVAAHVTALMRG